MHLALLFCRFHDMDNILDFIILEQHFKASLKHKWADGDRFRSMIDNQYWYGTILKRRPLSEDYPNSSWQCYHVKWDDGATDQLSPWDMQPVETDSNGDSSPPPLVAEDTAWGGPGEKERIQSGLLLVMEEMEEAEMFIEPVDLEEEPTYCTVVPLPTCLTTIVEKMKNGFYRSAIFLLQPSLYSLLLSCALGGRLL